MCNNYCFLYEIKVNFMNTAIALIFIIEFKETKYRWIHQKNTYFGYACK